MFQVGARRLAFHTCSFTTHHRLLLTLTPTLTLTLILNFDFFPGLMFYRWWDFGGPCKEAFDAESPRGSDLPSSMWFQARCDILWYWELFFTFATSSSPLVVIRLMFGGGRLVGFGWRRPVSHWVTATAGHISLIPKWLIPLLNVLKLN